LYAIITSIPSAKAQFSFFSSFSKVIALLSLSLVPDFCPLLLSGFGVDVEGAGVVGNVFVLNLPSIL